MMDQSNCAWCTKPFPPTHRGGHTKLFCSTPCRMAFHKAARQWAERQFRDGLITAADLSGVSRVVHAKRLASESGGPSTYPSDRGDQRKVFCSSPCWVVFHRAARRWAERQFFDGKVSARELHAGSPPCAVQRIAPVLGAARPTPA
jgi:hypothetical protein